MYKLSNLKNGLKVVTVNMPHMESVALGIWIKVGGRYENSKNNGISHFLEHMVFKGTQKKTGKDIKESIEGIGGTLNGFTGEENTCYFVKLTNEHIDLGLDVLSDMVLNPKLASGDINMEKGVILEEIKMYMDLPNHYVHDILSKLMWPTHALGMPLAGTLNTVKRISRRHLLAFKERFYSPENVVIACSGKLDGEYFLDKVKNHFKKAKKQPSPHSKKVNAKQSKMRSDYLYKNTEQTHLAIGFHASSIFHPDRYAADLLHVLLGGNMSSRLFHEVREKRGLAYDISTSSKHYNDTGSFIIGSGINNKKVPEAIDIILKELNKIKRNFVKPDEFRRARDFCRGQLLMALENTLSRMMWLGEKVATKDPLCEIGLVLEKLDEVKVEDIRRVAKEVLRASNLNVAMIGPLGDDLKRNINRRFHEGLD